MLFWKILNRAIMLEMVLNNDLESNNCWTISITHVSNGKRKEYVLNVNANGLSIEKSK